MLVLSTAIWRAAASTTRGWLWPTWGTLFTRVQEAPAVDVVQILPVAARHRRSGANTRRSGCGPRRRRRSARIAAAGGAGAGNALAGHADDQVGVGAEAEPDRRARSAPPRRGTRPRARACRRSPGSGGAAASRRSRAASPSQRDPLARRHAPARRHPVERLRAQVAVEREEPDGPSSDACSRMIVGP